MENIIIQTLSLDRWIKEQEIQNWQRNYGK